MMICNSILGVPRNSNASCFVERSAKLFDKGARRRQIGKAPATIDLVPLSSATAVPELNASRLVKCQNAAVQIELQSGATDGKLYDIRMPEFINQRPVLPHNGAPREVAVAR
jgi:hypothetical protein